MPSRRRVLAVAGSALTGAAVAGCQAPLDSIPRIEDQDCPPMDRLADETVCSHTDTDGGIDLDVTPSSVPTGPEALEDLRLLIENNGDETITYDPRGWELYRTTGGGWNRRESDRSSSGETEQLPPGNSASWSGLDAIFGLGGDGPTPAGLYAAVLTVGSGAVTTGSNRQAGRPVDCIFLFRVADDVTRTT